MSLRFSKSNLSTTLTSTDLEPSDWVEKLFLDSEEERGFGNKVGFGDENSDLRVRFREENGGDGVENMEWGFGKEKMGFGDVGFGDVGFGDENSDLSVRFGVEKRGFGVENKGVEY